jgi:hypothetical protein
LERRIKTIHSDLHKKFEDNINKAFEEEIPQLDEMEIKARAIFYFGEILESDSSITDSQKEVAKIYNELFTDFTIASYLSCSGIDNGARIVLRRILELGIATVYLWDLPEKYWNWRNYDDYGSDLNFKDMLDHVNNRGYIDFINNENSSEETNLVNKDRLNKIYRELSNVIHGKSKTFESSEESSFEFQKADLESLATYTLKIQNNLISMWRKRFPSQFEQLENQFTPLTIYSYGR